MIDDKNINDNSNQPLQQHNETEDKGGAAAISHVNAVDEQHVNNLETPPPETAGGPANPGGNQAAPL